MFIGVRRVSRARAEASSRRPHGPAVAGAPCVTVAGSGSGARPYLARNRFCAASAALKLPLITFVEPSAWATTIPPDFDHGGFESGSSERTTIHSPGSHDERLTP